MSSEHNIIHTDESQLGHVKDLDDPEPIREPEHKVLLRGFLRLSLLAAGCVVVSFGFLILLYTVFQSFLDLVK